MPKREECRKTKGDPAEEPDRLLVSVVQHWYIVQVDDGRGIENPLNLIVEIKGCRGEDGREQKGTMDTY